MFKKWAGRLTHHLPDDLLPSAGLKKQWQSWLTKQLTHYNLISREEFDAQAKVLARTQAQLVRMEAELKSLEEKVRDIL